MTPGQAAFEKWAKLVIPEMPLPWSGLPIEAKSGWQRVAESAIEANKCGVDGKPCTPCLIFK